MKLSQPILLIYIALLISIPFTYGQDQHAQTNVVPGFKYDNFSLTRKLVQQVVEPDGYFLQAKYRKAAKLYRQLNAQQTTPDKELRLREAACYVELNRLETAYAIYLKRPIDNAENLVRERDIAGEEKNAYRLIRIERVLLDQGSISKTTQMDITANKTSDDPDIFRLEVPGFEYETITVDLNPSVGEADSLFQFEENYTKAARRYRAINKEQATLNEELMWREADCYVNAQKLAVAHRKYLDIPSVQRDSSLIKSYNKLLSSNKIRAAKVLEVINFTEPSPHDVATALLNTDGKYYAAKPYFKRYSRDGTLLTPGARYIEEHTFDSVHVRRLDYPVNSIYADFGTGYYKNGEEEDVIVFSSEKSQKVASVNGENRSVLELYQTTVNRSDSKVSPPQKIHFRNDSIKQDLTFNEGGPMVFLENGTKMIFTKNRYFNQGKLFKSKREDLYRGVNDGAEVTDIVKSNINALGLYTSHKINDTLWSAPEPIVFEQGAIDFFADQGTYSFGHPSLSQDETRLYFSSDGPIEPTGFESGTYIYMSRKLNDSIWRYPQLVQGLAEVESNNLYPFVHYDPKEKVERLYFASNRPRGFGGLDIYWAELGQDGLSIVTPKAMSDEQKKNSLLAELNPSAIDNGNTITTKIFNLGKNFNSSHDDFAFVIDKKGGSGYFSSDRDSVDIITGNDNIYRFEAFLTQNLLVDEKVCQCDVVQNYKPTANIQFQVHQITPQGNIPINTSGNAFYAKQGERYNISAVPTKGYASLVSKEITVTEDNASHTLKLEPPCIKIYSIQNKQSGGQVFLTSNKSIPELNLEKGTLMEFIIGNEDSFLKNISTGETLGGLTFAPVQVENTENEELSCGCVGENRPEMTMEEIAIQSLLQHHINGSSCPGIGNLRYDFDRLDIREGSYADLNNLVYLMEANPNIEMELYSHADERGNNDYNKILSIGRANSAKDYMTLTLLLTQRLKLRDGNDITALSGLLYKKNQTIDLAQIFERFNIKNQEDQDLVRLVAKAFTNYDNVLERVNRHIPKNNQKTTIFKEILKEVEASGTYTNSLNDIRESITAIGKGEEELICENCRNVSPGQSDATTKCCHEINRRTDYKITYPGRDVR
ncbi:hypothetical protein QQ008_22345 [Fulvivirgaceae bacterium BMA10]|uniref:OmpA-like domain-containing protein n=1 Tax=Splendidivirga corallicola TaxID=3051826 RepID=A0ABT8KXK5_9BACT|nr:hypothetical protein [Fulvivirgaceae bacterium BMA10]